MHVNNRNNDRIIAGVYSFGTQYVSTRKKNNNNDRLILYNNV